MMARSGRALRFLTLFFIVLAGLAWGAWAWSRSSDAPWLTDVAAYRQAMTAAAVGSGIAWAAFWGVRRIVRRRGGKGARSVAQFQTIIAIVIVAVVAAGTFGELSTTVLSLGLVGFGLTLALQRPILALAGWATIFFGNMFREGDRIQVGDLEGDVVDITLFTTKLWEIGGKDSRSPGRPTARIRTVSNAVFLEQPVANATSDTAVVFDEFVVNVAFESDQDLAEDLLRSVGRGVVDPEKHKTLAATYRRLTRGLTMETNFPTEPVVLAESKPSWMEYRLRYLVDARMAGRVQAAMTKAWNQATSEHPDRILTIYPRNQAQRIGGDGRPLDSA